MKLSSHEPALTRGDVASLWAFVAVGVLFAIATIVSGTMRIIEVVGNNSVTVSAVFSGTPAEAPIGPNGTPVTVELESAQLTVDSLPAASVAAGVIEVLITILATLTVIACLILLCRELMRGRIFSRRNTRIAVTAGIAWLIGYSGSTFFANMVSNGAFARISDRVFNNIILQMDLSAFLFGAFVAAFVSSIFAVGARLQRDQEGLV